MLFIIAKMPETLFILRPHPVADQRYWHEKLIPQRNLQVIYRNAVEPWIHSATAVIHAGCTVGLQSEIANIPAIDLSQIMNDQRNPEALSKEVSRSKPEDIRSLIKEIRNIQQEKRADGKEHLVDTSYENIFAQNLGTLNSRAVNYLMNKIGLPNNISATQTCLKDIAGYAVASRNNSSVDNTMEHASNLLGKQVPNSNKSRIYSSGEIIKKVNGAIRALHLNKKIRISKFDSYNVFGLSSVNQ